jgi:putative photosynthetic complex assembly protein
MSAVPHTEHIPRSALIGAAVLVVMTLLLATVVRVSGIDIRSLPDPRPLITRELKFKDLPDGGVAVMDGRSGHLIQVLAPGSNGFLRATMRNLAHERRRQGFDDSVPFRLLASPEGRLVLEDPTTGEHLELEAFGQTNAAVFARLLGDAR